MNCYHWLQKKKVHSVLRFFKELVSKNGEADELQIRWGNLWHVVNFNVKWNETSFSLKVIRLIFNTIWSVPSTTLEMLSFGIQPTNCLVSLPKTKKPIVFSFPRDKSILISCNWCLFAKTAVSVLQNVSLWTKIVSIICFFLWIFPVPCAVNP